MTAYLCVGGPMHGQMYEHACFDDIFEVTETRPVEVKYEVPTVIYPNWPFKHTYRRCGIGPNCIVWLHSSIPVTP